MLTSSPYKHRLEIHSCPAIPATKPSVKRPATESTTKGTGRMKKPNMTQETSQSDARCLCCGEMCSQSRCGGEKWSQCLMSKQFANQDCSGTETDSLCCDLCTDK